MIDRLIAGFLLLTLGIYSGIQLESRKSDRQLAKAQAIKTEQLTILSRNYYEQFESISNRDPVTVERRVFVKADCVPAGASTGLGDVPHAGGLEADRAATGGVGKVELAPDTVQAVAGVADRAERLYQQCVTRLQYFQDRHK